ncbi:MAG: hypothetical protein ACYCV5_09700 [Acidimicrobiales bacterium]|jgi:hypothetical protein
MTQPSFVPIVESDQVRGAYRLRVPSIWTQSRPSELRGPAWPSGRSFGTPGPDQGFALTLARRFEDRLVLAEGERAEDAIAGAAAVASRRAGHFGRAPSVYDLQFAFTLFGFLGEPPADLVAARQPVFRAAAHHYEVRRAIADLVPSPTLGLSPDALAVRIGEWRELLPELAPA